MAHKCLSCGAIFYEPDYIQDRQWHSEVGAYENMSFPCCPDCGSEDFEDFDEEEELDND